ncbi:AfsR/SARP family transcriptional regulator [Micromonospora maris]|uniref:AfsR/SARP family transcriptional regulator n=1 Tax=Micromonospora maris TaxID=1003110 RepID=UPI002E0D83E2|nr:tetratricopeptide repeat protein [Micromonospora maris]
MSAAEEPVQIQVLGGLAVRHGSAVLPLGTPKQRTVLAMLACNPGRLVSVAQLVDELWSEEPPQSAIPNVRTYAANLRRSLAKLVPERELLTRVQDGYRLDVERSDVDLFAFQAEVAEARRLVPSDEVAAVELLSGALARWQGPALTGIALGPSLSAQVVVAAEDRMLAAELYARLQIRLGNYDEALPVLRNLLITQPLREPAHLLLMQALHLRGDHAGAVAAYATARRALREQLNIEPGGELQQFYQRIAAHERRVTHREQEAGRSATVAPGGNGQVIRSFPPLPRVLPDFIGRADAVERLLAETRRAAGVAPAVHFIDGMAGSGKTSLAMHVAAQLTDRFPDAQLFIDLKGHNQAESVAPTTALAVLLRQLGVPGNRIPGDFDERVSLWRHELASRRGIVVLDNAAGTEQVLPLLPSGPGNVVIVTSRRRITGLDGGPPVSLSVMTLDEGVALLASAAGAQRVAAEPDAAATVVKQCGHLPLAIRLAGSRLAHRPTWRVADLAALLVGNAHRLVHLASGDRSVAKAFAASYESLGEPARRLFRLLSVHPGDYFDVLICAAVTGFSMDDTTAALNELLDCHLVDEVKAGRYRMHDLIRQYAHELSITQDRRLTRDRALVDLVDIMLHLSFPIAEELESRGVRKYVSLDPPRLPDLLAVTASRTKEWMEDERPTLVALVVRAGEWGHHDHSWRLARALWRFLYVRGYYDDIIRTHLAGLEAAREAKNEPAAAIMHNYAASAYLRKGNYAEALNHVRAAVMSAERSSDFVKGDRYRANLVAVHWIRGELDEAVRVGLEGLRWRKGFDLDELPTALPNVGLALAMLGRYDEALRLHRLHLYLARQYGNQFHLLNALSHIGAVKCRVGQHKAAIRALRAALALRERTGDRFAEAEVRNDLGIALRGLGRVAEAAVQHEAARQLAVEAGEPHVQAAALNDLALTMAILGDGSRASDLHHEALRLATRIAHRYEQGRALAGLAEHLLATDPAEARRHWERALAIFRRMGVPEQAEVERRLAQTDQGS